MCWGDRLASANLGRQGASHQQPRLQSGLPGLLRTSSHKTPELSHTTPRQGAGWAHHSHGRSRSEVTRLGREVGGGALYTMCKCLLHIRKAGVLNDGLPEKHSSWTQNASSGRRQRWKGVGPACWRLGDEGRGCQCQGVNGVIVPQPGDGRSRERVRRTSLRVLLA